MREWIGIGLCVFFLIGGTLAAILTMLTGALDGYGPLSSLVDALIELVGVGWAAFAQFSIGGALCGGALWWAFGSPTPRAP